METVLPSDIKWHWCFLLSYLRFTLVHSKGQGQDQARFKCEYL